MSRISIIRKRKQKTIFLLNKIIYMYPAAAINHKNILNLKVYFVRVEIIIIICHKISFKRPVTFCKYEIKIFLFSE